MNNCVVRTILSAVLGSGMGVMFGVFMGTMDTVGAPGILAAGSRWCSNSGPHFQPMQHLQLHASTACSVYVVVVAGRGH
jgi:hypothetical protein